MSGCQSVQTKKRRGRKQEAWEKSVQSAREKINLHRDLLKTAKQNGVSAEQKVKWRNVISAQ